MLFKPTKERVNEDGAKSDSAHIGPNIDEVRHLKEVEPALQAIIKGFRDADKKFREATHHECARACGIAGFLVATNLAWRRFVDSDKWKKGKRPKLSDQDEALRWVLIRAMGPGKKASKYFCALEKFVHDKVPVSEIPDLLKEEGIEKRAKARAKRLRAEEGDNALNSEDNARESSGRDRKSNVVKVEIQLQLVGPRGKALLRLPRKSFVQCKLRLDDIKGHKLFMTVKKLKPLKK
jgi:hypothetical protein